MNLLLVLAIVACVLCAIPLAMTIVNLRLYRRSDPGAAAPDPAPPVRVCIPARNEATNLEPCVRSLLDGDYPNLTVLVYDDQSTDDTPRILERLTQEDPCVRRVETVPLPAGWNGKQHACWRTARAALDARDRHADRPEGWLLFTDADVRFSPDCVRRSLAEARRLEADLLSTFPRQITGSVAETALVPMMFYLLLGYLPLARMRSTLDPAASAGCGQFLLVRDGAYEASGGHEAFRDSMHDGIRMPREVRRAGLRSDLFDGTDLAAVRMYRGFTQTWRGFAKNAYEGLGSVGLLVFMTVVHLAGHLAPWALLPLAISKGLPSAAALAGLAILMQLSQRLLLAARLRHLPASALLHPLGVLGMTAIQWHSYILHLTGSRSWRGRSQAAEPWAG